jgi:hypothetical protein
MDTRGWAFGALAVNLMTSSCSTLPDYAQPRAELLDVAAYRPADVIGYRELSREDFRASSPPAQVASHASKVGAYTCANVVPQSQLRFRLAPRAGAPGYAATLEDAAFRAEMDRTCSWWNANDSSLPSAYVLQHEQIHFAIVEVYARRLSAELRGLQLRVDSPASATAALQREFDARMRDALEKIVEESARFDEDTSGRYAPERQDRWYQRVSAELAERE